MTDTHRADLLVELGCEELPPKALAQLAQAFFDHVCTGLADARLGFDADNSCCLYSPRRMALLLSSVDDRQADQVLERKGPSVSAAFDDDGQPTAAASGFARSVGQPVESLETLKTDKGEWLYCAVEQPGKPLDDLLFPLLVDALNRLPVPKPMRWSDHDFSFVRPVHWLVVLHGDRVLDGSLLGCAAGRTTRGHRIHSPGPHDIPSPSSYPDVLRQARVLVDPNERIDRVRRQAVKAGEAVGGSTRLTDSLLAEVNNLVEWPVAVTCRFDRSFLAVPAEALVASMESHQKFFPVLDKENGQLTEHFVVMANIESTDVVQVREGFERVVRPRLADAAFFWDRDLKAPLDAALPSLDKVVFQEKLGTIGDKTRRIAALSIKIAELLGVDVSLAERAALLAKCDLVSHMVGEFPELQGTMGRYYAQAAGEPETVSHAVETHYWPRFAGDDIPPDPVGQVVALADRLDTLVGIFATGLKPTGNKDPFALRRASLGIIRILMEGTHTAPLGSLLALASDGLANTIELDQGVMRDVDAFVMDRLRQALRDRGFSANAVRATLSAPLEGLPDLLARLEAVTAFMAQEEAESLVAANKRIGNILKKQDGDISPQIDECLLHLDEERALFNAVALLEKDLDEDFAQGRYEAGLARLAALRPPVDAYFDQVLIMDDDPGIRSNRLAQLARLKSLFDRVADFSQAG